MMSNFEIRGRSIACLTGANGDLGRQLIKDLHRHNCSLILLVREVTPEFCQYLETFDDLDFKIYECDLTDEEAVVATAKLIASENEQIDILINNAATAHGALLQMQSRDALHRVFQINFFSPFILTQYISRRMKKSGRGVIVNISSIAAEDPHEGYGAYGASKAALTQFSKIAAQELAAANIRVNSLAPSLFDTKMAAQQESRSFDTLLSRSVLKRLGTVAEISNTVLFLCSDAASFITGQNIRVDGGMN